ATIQGNLPLKVFKKTVPNVNAMIIYKTVQTGPKIQLGGDQNGFIKFEYQLYALFIFLINFYKIFYLPALIKKERKNSLLFVIFYFFAYFRCKINKFFIFNRIF